MPPSELDRIKEASQDALVFCFVGVGSAFAKRNAQTSLIIAYHGTTLLVDCGNTIPAALYEKGIGLCEFDYYHITHSHADHIGGVEELLLSSRYIHKRKPRLVITPVYQDILWEKSLKGGCEYNESGLLHFTDLIEPLRPDWQKAQPRELYHINLGGLDLQIFRTIHIPGEVTRWEQAFWSTGLLVNNRVLFSADTRFDPRLFEDLNTERVEAIFHDCQLANPGTVHATYDELKTLSPGIKRRMYLTHYGDSYEQYDAIADGFAGFAQAWKHYLWPDL